MYMYTAIFYNGDKKIIWSDSKYYAFDIAFEYAAKHNTGVKELI